MHITYASIVSVFSSKWKDLHAWNSCSLVLPIFEYCCLNKFCKPYQSTFMGVKDSYHNLVSPTNVKQNLWTLMVSRKWFAVIQLLVLNKWASASPSDFPKNSGLNVTNLNVLIVVHVVWVVWIVVLVVWIVAPVVLDQAQLEEVEVLEYLVLVHYIILYFIWLISLWYFFKFLLYFITSFTLTLYLFSSL